MRPGVLFVPLVALCLPVWPEGQARIIRRHDVADSVYLAAAARIHGLVHLNLSSRPDLGDGEGTLITPQWVLTAAHVAVEMRAGKTVTVGEDLVQVDRICRHPAWRDGGPQDIALLHLRRPTTADRPVPLYRRTDEADRILWVAGYGDKGDGLIGPTGHDRRVRAATNRVDEASANWLKFIFDPPGSSRTTPLEGISGPGDSGGPGYLEEHGELRVAGVSSGQDDGPSGGREGRYGVREFYTRVSTHLGWLDSTMAAPTCPT
jgi:hypothetical protein